MSRRATICTRVPGVFSWASQLGAHEWLIQRASLPRLPPSMTLPELMAKKKVWKGSSGLTGCMASACRSEEHTSELQSLMRISYAVFCLKKKKNKSSHTNKLENINKIT